jgi:hypothetical protein
MPSTGSHLPNYAARCKMGERHRLRWTGKTPAELSILVHEMVHHLQNVGQLQFACPEEREELAYKAQDQWLGLFGHDLLHDFDMDAFTIAVKSKCFN